MTDNIVNFKHLKIERGRKRRCTCENKQVIVDTTNRLIICGYCESILDPYEAVLHLAENQDKIRQDIEQMEHRREMAQLELKKYKPRSRAMRVIDRQVDKNNSNLYQAYPTCPVCSEPFKIEEIAKEWKVDALTEKRLRKRLKNGK